MTIDERLEKLTKRHEALTQTVEIIAGMQRENEERIEELVVLQQGNEESISRLIHLASWIS